jgi:oligosaccharide repeat unit polymerase
MLIFQIFVIVIFIAIAYFINNFDVLSVWLVMCVVFLFSSIVALMNQSTWGFDYSERSCLIIVLAVVVWGIGDAFAKITTGKINVAKESTFQARNMELISPSKKSVVAITFIMFVTTGLYLIYLYKISLIAGNPNGISGVLKYARYAVVNVKYDVSEPTYLAQLLNLSEASGLVFLFICIYNSVFFRKFSKLNFLPVFIYIIQISVSTARINFIHIISAFLMMTFILWKKKNNWSRSLDSKIVRYAIIGITLFLILFRLLGYLTDKSGNRELWSDFSIYTGSSIMGLDYFLKNPHNNTIIGQETLYNFYSVASKFGLTTVQKYNSTLEFFYFDGLRTNIYTALRRLIQDYGVAGMSGILLVESFFFGKWLERIKKFKVSYLSIILFSMFIYIVAEISIDEQFVPTLVAVNTIYRLFFVYVVYRIFIGKGQTL